MEMNFLHYAQTKKKKEKAEKKREREETFDMRAKKTSMPL